MKRFYLLSLLVVLTICSILSLTVLAEDYIDSDCTTTYGEHLGNNYIFETEESIYIIGSHLLMYDASSMSGEPIGMLDCGSFASLVDSEPGALLVSKAIGSEDGTVTYLTGWIDERFAVASTRIYVAMHPTPISIAPCDDSKLIAMLDTYNSLIVIDDFDDFYCVLLNGGIGYVPKE